jgi:hypothetical protein
VSRTFAAGAAEEARAAAPPGGATRQNSPNFAKNRRSAALDTPDAHVSAELAGFSPLVDAAAVAEYLSCERSWVYEHTDELGARRLGSGPRARLRFSLAEVDERLSACSGSRESEAVDPAPAAAPRPRRRWAMGTNGPLLPIRGREGESRG